MSDLMKDFDLENLSSYEREKLETTKSQLQRVADMIDLAVKMLDYCQKKDISIINRPSLNNLRQPDGLAGPESDISELESKLEKIQLSILEVMTEEKIGKMEKDLDLGFTTDKKIRKKKIDPGQTKGYNG